MIGQDRTYLHQTKQGYRALQGGNLRLLEDVLPSWAQTPGTLLLERSDTLEDIAAVHPDASVRQAARVLSILSVGDHPFINTIPGYMAAANRWVGPRYTERHIMRAARFPRHSLSLLAATQVGLRLGQVLKVIEEIIQENVSGGADDYPLYCAAHDISLLSRIPQMMELESFRGLDTVRMDIPAADTYYSAALPYRFNIVLHDEATSEHQTAPPQPVLMRGAYREGPMRIGAGLRTVRAHVLGIENLMRTPTSRPIIRDSKAPMRRHMPFDLHAAA